MHCPFICKRLLSFSFQASHARADGSCGNVSHFCVQRGNEYAWSLTSAAVATFSWQQLDMGQLHRRHTSRWGNNFRSLGMAMHSMLNKPFRSIQHEEDKGVSQVNAFTSNSWTISGTGFLLLLIFWTQHRAPAGPSAASVLTAFLRRTVDQRFWRLAAAQNMSSCPESSIAGILRLALHVFTFTTRGGTGRARMTGS